MTRENEANKTDWNAATDISEKIYYRDRITDIVPSIE